MNTLIDIALTIQPLKAHHSPTVELLCLPWERSCVQTAPYVPENRHTHPQQQKLLQLLRTFNSAYPWPSHKHTQRASHSTLYKIVTHTSFLTTHTSLSHNPSPGSDFTTQTVSLCVSLLFSLDFLSVFMDQWREQLHQRRSGGLEMKSCVAVGKHLATVREAEQEQD